MLADRTAPARHMDLGRSAYRSSRPQASRAAWICRLGSPWSIGFALTYLMLVGILPAVGTPVPGVDHQTFASQLDHNGNGVEDILDAWLSGQVSFDDLRQTTVAVSRSAAAKNGRESLPTAEFPAGQSPAAGGWQAGRLRVICLGSSAGQLAAETRVAGQVGTCRVVHSLDRFGGVAVLDLDENGLAAFLTSEPACRIMLDRDGVPALVDSRNLIGVGKVETSHWQLGDDWSSTVAILDSGCDTAHGDLGDSGDDDQDGPPPAVGDAQDWFAADNGWPLFEGYKVVGWQDVTDDFPEAAGPWDYHYHGTALASVVAGNGLVDPQYRGVSAGARLTVVKFYDFDQTWHAWAGDFLAACAWTLDHREIYRIRTVLTAVNWEVDAGISTAMADLVAAGLLPVAAVGNQGSDPSGPGFPARLPDVMTVGSVDGQGALASYSGRGMTFPSKPDLLAPGGGLLASGGRIIAADNEPNDSYSGRFGTSYAAAHAAGAVHLLDEALQENGVILPANRAAALMRSSVLKLTAAAVVQAENSAGTGHLDLAFPVGPDASRGWGLLRIDAAVDALLYPLIPGQDQVDTLSTMANKPVVARRLITSAGIRYLIEVVPSGSLDVVLEVADLSWLGDEATQGLIRRMDANGPGISEFTYLRPENNSWLAVAVKRKAGQGTVTLKIREADTFQAQGTTATLPGMITGAPNAGQVAGFSGPSLVIPSRVIVDLGARSVNVLDSVGDFRPGWPIFVFPHPSSQGGLSQPLVWDLDGSPGDEIVVSSHFGSVYFFAGSGAYQEVALTLNRSLSTPVGLATAGGNRRVAVVDKLGMVRTWSHGPVLEAERELGHTLPLDPGVGRLLPGAGESLVVSFQDGYVTALDPDLNPLPGWPADLGVPLTVPPVLCDLNGDGFHEVVQPALDEVTGLLTMRVLDSQGQPVAGDGAVVPSPIGGGWVEISSAAVTGRFGSTELAVVLTGLADNGQFGDQAQWVLGTGTMAAGAVAGSETLPGFRVKATTSQGILTVDNLLLTSPLTWNFQGVGQTGIHSLVSFNWSEVLLGFTSLPGAFTGWIRPGNSERPLVGRRALIPGGRSGEMFPSSGSLLVPAAGDAPLRVDVLDNLVRILPIPEINDSVTPWASARSDGRNSGAYPISQTVSVVRQLGTGTGRLVVYPNPGSGQFQFRVSGLASTAGLALEIFDLRGRRLRVMDFVSGQELMRWDGTDRQGRPLAAGTYLAVTRGAGPPLVTRVVLTR